MCEPATIIAGASLAVGAAGAASSYVGQRNAAKAQNQYATQADAIADINRREQRDYENKVYAQDLQYAEETLKWQKGQFEQAKDYIDTTQKAIEKDYLQKVTTLLTRQVEEGMAAAFGIQTEERKGRAARASAEVAAGERGISGNSVDAIIGDILKETGEATDSINLSLDALNQQLGLEAKGIKSASDSALANLQSPSFAPIGPARTPGGTPHNTPTPRAQGPSGMDLAVGVGSAAVGAAGTYTQLGGKFKIGGGTSQTAYTNNYGTIGGKAYNGPR